MSQKARLSQKLAPGPLWNTAHCLSVVARGFEHWFGGSEEADRAQPGFSSWVDLDIDLDRQHDDSGWKWNLNFEVSSKIDKADYVWYGAMRIPYAAIDSRPAAAGNTLRINLFRCQGPASRRHYIAWRAPVRDSFHVPERFGTLKLAE